MRRLLQAVRLERDAFVWMDFNDRATGDALIFVLVTRILVLLASGWSILGLTTSLSGIDVLVQAMINVAVFWLVYSGLVYATARFIFQAGGSFPTTLRIAGLAYPTFLVQIATAQLIGNNTLAFAIGSLWFVAIVTAEVRYEADLSTEKAAAAAVAGVIGWIILSSILNGGLI